MARIQILELPLDTEGEYARTPFAIIVDEVTSFSDIHRNGDALLRFKEAIGASAVLITGDTIKIPANDFSE